MASYTFTNEAPNVSWYEKENGIVVLKTEKGIYPHGVNFKCVNESDLNTEIGAGVTWGDFLKTKDEFKNLIKEVKK